VVTSIFLSRRITVPIKRLGKTMQIFESGSIPDKVEVRATGEIEMLVHGFNTMLDNIKTNIDAIYQEQEEKQRAEVAALEYQLQSLQQQINPHFLYNTLNVISYLAMEERSEDIRSFVLSLNQLLRSTLSNTQDEVTVRQEIAFLQAYIAIMEYRYKDVFAVEMRTDPKAARCLIPKLILQPLAENALLHGIYPSGRKGVITVTVELAPPKLAICVRDDGVGFDVDSYDLQAKTKGFNSIGLKNVNERLVLCYGPEAALDISSEKGKGTVVRFKIPIMIEE